MLSLARRYDSRRPAVTAEEARDWHALFVTQGIGDCPHEDLTDAVKDHYGRTREWLMPFDVVAYCKRVRRTRIEAAGNIYALVQADPNNQTEYQAEYRRLHADVAAGRLDPRAQLEGL